MATNAKVEVKNQDVVTSLQTFLKSVLEQDQIGAMLVSQHLPMKNVVMPTLVTDPEALDQADPLAPSFPLNAAKVVSRLTRKPSGAKIAAILRPCEIRAFVELVKLHQADRENLILIGYDCLGAYQNTDYTMIARKHGEKTTQKFCEQVLSENELSSDDIQIAVACKACEHPVPEGVDLTIGLLGVPVKEYLWIKADTDAGEKILDHLNFSSADEPADRKKAVETLIEKRLAFRDRMFEENQEATKDIEKLATYLAGCVNCYNCRVACPVCYCRECVFVTDVFDHEPSQYVRWAKRKKLIKMPTDTVFFHITRLAHMSTACVGCGQCSNACPNDIPVMELFRTVAHKTQQAFDYEAGRNLEEPPPLSVFKEEEFKELTAVNE
ncbi:MAG: 4Fe-4S dicluster domain-containing protein [Desulfobacterales bacterium]